jgi:hypothetical protein
MGERTDYKLGGTNYVMLVVDGGFDMKFLFFLSEKSIKPMG